MIFNEIVKPIKFRVEFDLHIRYLKKTNKFVGLDSGVIPINH
jgi:hypothetical protein